MRTTVMLPSDLMRAAKARSAERGESLKTLLTRALATELDHHPTGRTAPDRVTLPLFGSDGPPVRLSNADLERVLADTDASIVSRHHAAPARRKHAR